MRVLSFLAAVTLLSAPAFSEEVDDGTYDATVTTSSGTYTVPVEVEDGEVTEVHWPNGGHMNVVGGELDDGAASGSSYDGRWVDVEIDE